MVSTMSDSMLHCWVTSFNFCLKKVNTSGNNSAVSFNSASPTCTAVMLHVYDMALSIVLLSETTGKASLILVSSIPSSGFVLLVELFNCCMVTRCNL